MGKHLPTTVVASYLVLVQGDQVLLARRANTGYFDGHYSVPAGHVEMGETFTQALVREVAEEVGIRLNPLDARVVHTMHRKAEDGSERLDTFFVVKEWTGEIENREPEKCDDLSWFPLAELPDNTIPYIKIALAHIQAGVSYSEFGW